MRSIASTLTAVVLAWSGATAAGTIQQTVEFPGVAPEAVYDTYLSAKGHGAMTGFPASFYRPSTKAEVEVGEEGDEFRGFGVKGKDGAFQYLIGGRLLHLVPGKQIVMTWHAAMWGGHQEPGTGPSADCILVLTFKSAYGGTEIDLVQTDIPEFPGLDAEAAPKQYSSETSTVNTNWYFRYWAPMQKYFQSQAAKPSA